jgi:hypothetical protein
MSLKEKIDYFKKQSIKTRLLAAVFLVSALALGLFLFFSVLEYTFWFDTTVRLILFYSLILLLVVLLSWLVLPPALILFGFKKSVNDEEAAKEISAHISEINDDLINYLQLEKNGENELAKASLDQKTIGLERFDFLKAIDFTSYKRFGKAFTAILILTLLIVLFYRPIITSGTQRLILHNKEFSRPAPFDFIVLNDSLTTFYGEGFELKVKLVGKNISKQVSLVTANGSVPMTQGKKGEFSYYFTNPKETIPFFFESAGFSSSSKSLTVLNRPLLNLMSVDLQYPKHVGLTNETLTNGGNITAPSGTTATWTLTTSYADDAFMIIDNDTIASRRLNQNQFSFSRKLIASGNYTILLNNQHAVNESSLSYRLNINQDEHPAIGIEFIADTTNYKFVVVTGNISDDFGFHSLNLFLEIGDKTNSTPIVINKSVRKQGFYGEWLLDSLKIRPDQSVRFYAVVRDNDGPNGFKSAKSSSFNFKKPSLQELSSSIDKKGESAEKQFDKSLDEMKALQKQLDELAKKLKSQNKLGWQEEKMLEESLQQRQELEKMLQELKEKHDDLLKANENFSQKKETKEKSEELNKLIEDLMDDSTRQLYEELQKLMQEKGTADQVRDKLNEINRNESRMRKDLERTKELFKRLKMEAGLQRVSQQLDTLANKQQELSEQPLDSSATEQQEELSEEFEELNEDLENLEKLNQELDKPEPLEDFDSDEKQISQEMKQAVDKMKAGDKENAKKNQQNAAQKMREMSKKMQNMQAGMEMEVMQENIENLRKIMDDLIRLSYKQEDIIAQFRTVNTSDPRFIQLSQDQVKLKDDLVVIEDSLLSLASRVVQLSSFITKEVDEINLHMSASVEQIKERQRGRAQSHQQFAMTSMNNLALLLDDVLQNMQMTMSESMGKGKKGQEQNMPLPGLGEMQKQLGNQIQQLGEKSGRQLSEELARLAAEQELIRQQLEELQKKLKGQMGGESISDDISKAIKMMEDNEVDLVNKRLTRQLMERQKEITTRLLEAENALKEQEKDPEREGETGLQRERIFPPKFEEYLKQRKKEIELLRSIPIELKPFYKKEVNDYFRRLSEKN